VEKIAAIAKRIRPERIQLNTISRPPAEEFACPLKTTQMDRLKQLLPGMVETICEQPPAVLPATVETEISDADILALLRRRPCTVQGISSGLGLNPSETLKRLQLLGKQGKVKAVRIDYALFYETVRPR
jgi:wyosine [tRNA(Phe)-imidazoG37] synthetase (radical SAM superfamily)